MIEPICAIGFSSTRDLTNPERVKRKIAGLLDELERKPSDRLIAVSSIAIGADIIFVEDCLARGFPWIAVLPMPPASFFSQRDFPDEKTRVHAMSLLGKANFVEITYPCSDAFPGDFYRHMAFSDSGQRIMDHCDVFIAVLPHSHALLKPGGTAQIVKNLKRTKRPLAVINADD